MTTQNKQSSSSFGSSSSPPEISQLNHPIGSNEASDNITTQHSNDTNTSTDHHDKKFLLLNSQESDDNSPKLSSESPALSITENYIPKQLYSDSETEQQGDELYDDDQVQNTTYNHYTTQDQSSSSGNFPNHTIIDHSDNNETLQKKAATTFYNTSSGPVSTATKAISSAGELLSSFGYSGIGNKMLRSVSSHGLSIPSLYKKKSSLNLGSEQPDTSSSRDSQPLPGKMSNRPSYSRTFSINSIQTTSSSNSPLDTSELLPSANLNKDSSAFQSQPTTALSFATDLASDISAGFMTSGQTLMDYQSDFNNPDDINATQLKDYSSNYGDTTSTSHSLLGTPTTLSYLENRSFSTSNSKRHSVSAGQASSESVQERLTRVAAAGGNTKRSPSSRSLFNFSLTGNNNGNNTVSSSRHRSVSGASTYERNSNASTSLSMFSESFHDHNDEVNDEGSENLLASSPVVTATSSSMSPIVPTISMEHNSDVATLLSEVLDSENATINSVTANNASSSSGNDNDNSSGQAQYDQSAINGNLDYNNILGATNKKDENSVNSHSDTGLGFPELESSESEVDENENESQLDDEESSEVVESAASEDEIRAKSEERELKRFLSRKKQYFILSTAGKPVYSMYGSDSLVTGYMGVFQAIVSYFEDNSAENNSNSTDSVKNREGLRFLKAGNTIFVFALEDPLILIAVDKLGQTEPQLRAQLDLLYTQILSTLTKSQLSKVFKGRTNFDLRSLLGGTEVFLDALTREMSFGSPRILLGALECLRLRKSVRSKMHTILSESRSKSLLYGMIVADSRLVAVIRPRRHSLHPPDLHLIFSMLYNTQTFSKGSGEHWVPICLPKFNSTGFLYAYIHFFSPPDVALVLISADKNAFFELQGVKEKVVQDLQTQNLISPILSSLSRGRYRTIEILGTHASSYHSTNSNSKTKSNSHEFERGALLGNDMSIPPSLSTKSYSQAPHFSGIRHFLYKSKQNVQFVMPSFDPHYMDDRERHKLMVLYHQLHADVHSGPRSGGSGIAGGGSNLRVYHVSRGEDNGSALAWITPSFELYGVTGEAHDDGIDNSNIEDLHLEEEEDGNNNENQLNTEEGNNNTSNAAIQRHSVNPINQKDAMLHSVRAIVNWIKTHEERLFIFGGAVF